MKLIKTISLLLLLGVTHSALAFRFGPRIGLYNESFKNACFNSREFGLQLGFLFEKSPNTECAGGNCQGAIAPAMPCGCAMSMQAPPQYYPTAMPLHTGYANSQPQGNNINISVPYVPSSMPAMPPMPNMTGANQQTLIPSTTDENVYYMVSPD